MFRPCSHWPRRPNRCPEHSEHDQHGHDHEWELLIYALDYHYAIEGPAELEDIFHPYRHPDYEYDLIRAHIEAMGVSRWVLEHYGVLYPWMHEDLGEGNFEGIGNFEAPPLHYDGGGGGGDFFEVPHDHGGHGGHGGGGRRMRGRPGGARGGRGGGGHGPPPGFQHADRTALNLTQMPTMAAYSAEPAARSGRAPRDSARAPRDPARATREGNRRPQREPSPSDDEESGPERSDGENGDSDAGSEYRPRYRPTEMAAASSGQNQRAARPDAGRRRGGAVDLDEIEEEDGEDEYRRQHAGGRERAAQASGRPRNRY